MMKIHKNIVFIGMPGCGKTTIGKLVAERLLLPFCDVDEYIEKTEGKSIKDIFINGEAYFRKIESEAIKEISKISPLVISTGGGCVKISQNIEVFRSNSIIIFLNRPIENIVSDIDISGRPLLVNATANIYKLYKERYPLYKKYCDYEIHNDRSLSVVVDEVIKCIKSLLEEE
jgi:shikimate kinase